MLLRNEAKVGTLIFVAVLAVIATYWFLRGFGLGAATYPVYAVFADVRTLDKQSDVRMAGVKIGYVSDITLTSDSRARVDLIIWNRVCIPEDSLARITTGGFIGDNYVEVLAGAKRQCLRTDQRMLSREPINYDKLVDEVGSLVDQLKISVGSINSIVGDKQTVANLKQAVEQLNLAAHAATGLVRSAEGLVSGASPEVHKTLANMTEATSNAIKISKDLQAMVQSDMRPGAKEILLQARKAMTDLSEATAGAKDIISAVGGNVGRIDKTLTKVDAAAQQMQEMMANMNDASKSIKDIATDQQIKANIKDTMQNAADASAQAKTLLSNLNQKLGKYIGPSTGASQRTYKAPSEGFTVDSLWNTTEGDYRFDANYTLGFGRDFYRIGAFNIGETTRANLQGGMMLTDTTSLRYGIYASRVGIGMDQRLGNRFLLSGDILRPNDPQYDLRGVFKLNNGFGLYGGVSNILGPQDFFTGLNYTK